MFIKHYLKLLVYFYLLHIVFLYLYNFHYNLVLISIEHQRYYYLQNKTNY